MVEGSWRVREPARRFARFGAQRLVRTMLRLMLLRHAEAVARAATDLERRLAEAGRAGAARMGAYIRTSGLVPDLAIVSPATRARETFELVEQELPQRPEIRLEPSLYNASLDALQALLAQTPTHVETLLIVGHNPSVAEFACALASDGDRNGLAGMRRSFPAPCLVVIDFPYEDWKDVGAGRGWLDRFVTLASLP
jgi:phosphohistidine phosphatase